MRYRLRTSKWWCALLLICYIPFQTVKSQLPKHPSVFTHALLYLVMYCGVWTCSWNSWTSIFLSYANHKKNNRYRYIDIDGCWSFPLKQDNESSGKKKEKKKGSSRGDKFRCPFYLCTVKPQANKYWPGKETTRETWWPCFIIPLITWSDWIRIDRSPRPLPLSTSPTSRLESPRQQVSQPRVSPSLATPGAPHTSLSLLKILLSKRHSVSNFSFFRAFQPGSR